MAAVKRVYPYYILRPNRSSQSYTASNYPVSQYNGLMIFDGTNMAIGPINQYNTYLIIFDGTIDMSRWKSCKVTYRVEYVGVSDRHWGLTYIGMELISTDKKYSNSKIVEISSTSGGNGAVETITSTKNITYSGEYFISIWCSSEMDDDGNDIANRRLWMTKFELIP